jgi:arylformamidase
MIELTTEGRSWRADAGTRFDLAIELKFGGPQPLFFAGNAAYAEPLRADGFVGSVQAGASCNCGVYTIAPHCHGTHSECVGHVTNDSSGLSALTPAPLCLALLISVDPVPLGNAAAAPAEAADAVLNGKALAEAARRWAGKPWRGLILRTLPNDVSKKSRRYAGSCPAPYLTGDAMHWIVERGVDSLVVDLPSLDRADDGGALAAHRIFWGLPSGATQASLAARAHALVTELAFIPDEMPDGLYLMDLQIPAFATDAAPSRPVLYPVKEID